MIVKVGSSYKDSLGNLWECKAMGMNLNKERFALLINKQGVVWFTTELDWSSLKLII